MRIKHIVRYRKDYGEFAAVFVMFSLAGAGFLTAALPMIEYLADLPIFSLSPLISALAPLIGLAVCALGDVGGVFDKVPIVEHKVTKR